MVTMRLPIELLIEYFLRFVWITCCFCLWDLTVSDFSNRPYTPFLSNARSVWFSVHSFFFIRSFYRRCRFWLALLLSQVTRKFTSKVEGKMGYEDFVYFILSEEDKSSEPSLEYWYLFLIHYPFHSLVSFSEKELTD